LNKARLIITTIIAITVPGMLCAQPNISVDGLALFPYWRLDSRNSVQFDQSINFSADWNVSPRAKLFINLQSGVGNGALGLQGPQIAVTDLGLEYKWTPTQTLTLGSFDMPFGQEVAKLTNNGSLGASGFVLNPLLYTALAGPAGTLNTVGVMLTQPLLHGEGKAFVSNGTGENAVNEDTQLAYGFQWTTDTKKDTVIGISAWTSNDQADLSNTNATGVKADSTAYLIDLHTKSNNITYSGHIGQAWFGDGSTKTSLVTVGMASIATRYQSLDLRARISAWLPSDNNGDNAGISTRMPDPSMGNALGDTPPVDRNVIRYQLGVSAPLEKGVVLGSEIFLDQVQYGQQAMGVISYVSAQF
jgi:hypothetical protein